MKIINFKERISVFLKANPDLTYDKIGVLLLIDGLYADLPKDLEKFRSIFSHFDPNVLDTRADGMMFMDLARSDDPTSVIRHRLNLYINNKFNALGNPRPYRQNMEMFRNYSKIASDLLSDILLTARFPSEINQVLGEIDEVRDCMDFFELLEIYKKTKSSRTRFEILRKLGLMINLARISRTFLIDDIDYAIAEVRKVFFVGLGLKKKAKKIKYLWIDSDNNIAYTDSRKIAEASYKEAVKKRNKLALKVHNMQIFEYFPLKSRLGTDLVHIEMRNKLKKRQNISYTSFVEKMFRKNLEFPNQVHDVIGVKMLVESEDEIPSLIKNLETFLGGSSTRRKEKNALNKFGKKSLGKYSSKDYSVWKAVYDIPLPHPFLPKLKRLLALTKDNRSAQSELRERIAYFKKRPRDFVVEVQIQQLSSHLLSIAKGSKTDHSYLKMNQIRTNSFYKFFPKEIYKKHLFRLRQEILKKY